MTAMSTVLRRLRSIVQGQSAASVLPRSDHRMIESYEAAAEMILRRDGAELGERQLNVSIARACYSESGAAYCEDA